MELDTACASLIGDRAENQDRADILIGDEATFAILADGMGGHADGALAAETAIASLSSSFRAVHGRKPDPAEFLREAITTAHAEVLALGEGMALESRPGTIIVCALVLGDAMWWAHVGDSRAYHLRGGKILERTQDHTEVDALLAAGKITSSEAETHPGRHVVEYCLGVVADTPPGAVTTTAPLQADDIIVLCSDGLWSQLDEDALLARLDRSADLDKALHELVQYAAQTGSPHSDNVTAIALRTLDDD